VISGCGDQLIGWREQISQKTAALSLNKIQPLIETKTTTNPKYRNPVQPTTDLLHGKTDEHFKPENLKSYRNGQMVHVFSSSHIQNLFCAHY
jgi:hypothetical protein